MKTWDMDAWMKQKIHELKQIQPATSITPGDKFAVIIMTLYLPISSPMILCASSNTKHKLKPNDREYSNECDANPEHKRATRGSSIK